MPHRQERSDPSAHAGKIAAGKTPFVDDVHLIKQFGQPRTARKRQPPREEGLGLQQVTEFIVIGRGKVAKPEVELATNRA